jgi:hypothetical protein
MVIWKDHNSKQPSGGGNGPKKKVVATGSDDSFWQHGSAAVASFSPSIFSSSTTTTPDHASQQQGCFYLQRRAAIDAHQVRFRTFSKQLKDVANIFRQLQKARIAYDIAQGKVRTKIYIHFYYDVNEDYHVGEGRRFFSGVCAGGLAT